MGLKSIMSLGRKSGKQDSTATGTVTFQESLPSTDINAASKESIPMNSWRESRMVAPHETSDAKCDMMDQEVTRAIRLLPFRSRQTRRLF
jgi:hypothetical protein